MRFKQLSCALLITAFCTVVAGESHLPPGTQWPWYRGPFSNGSAIEADGPLAEKPVVRWHSREYTKNTTGTIAALMKNTGGNQTLVMHDNRVYVSFYVGSQDPVVLDVDAMKDENKARDGRPKWEEALDIQLRSLAHVGFQNTPEDRIRLRNMLWNVHADDVVVCLDADTGETLWKNAVPGGINFQRSTYGPHFTPSVDPTTGKMYAIGTTGRILCFDGKTGDLLWQETGSDRYKKDSAMLAKCLADRKTAGNNRQRTEWIVAVDGVVFHEGRALDGATGKELYKGPGGNILPWQHNGVWYVLTGGTRCYEVKTGKEMWNLGRSSIPEVTTGSYGLNFAVDGDIMVTEQHGFRISPSGRELLWHNPYIVNSGTQATAIHRGRFYLPAARPSYLKQAHADGKVDATNFKALSAYARTASKEDRLKLMPTTLSAFDLATGELRLEIANLGASTCNGTLLMTTNERIIWADKSLGWMWMDVNKHYGFGPEKDVLAPFNLRLNKPEWSVHNVHSPIGYKGRVYIRAKNSVICVDFNQGAKSGIPDDFYKGKTVEGDDSPDDE